MTKRLGRPALAMSFDPRERAEELSVPTAQLHQVVDGLNDVKRRTDEALAAKQEAMEAYDQSFVRTARIFEEYFLYVGDRELARWVRPSSLRPGRTELPPVPSLGSEVPGSEVPSSEVPSSTPPADEPDEEPQGDSDSSGEEPDEGPFDGDEDFVDVEDLIG